MTTKHSESVLSTPNDIPFVECAPNSQLFVYNDEANMEFPYVSQVNDARLEDGFQYICYITNGGVTERDAPEFISVDEIHLPSDYTGYFSGKEAKQDAKTESQESVISVSSDSGTVKVPTDSDDDVVFVTMYNGAKTTSTTTTATSGITLPEDTTSTQSKVIRRRRRKKNGVVTPRRNPKRVAQMEKASVDLAMKLSLPPAIFNTKIPRYGCANAVKNCRQSCRTTGAIFCPPSPLSNKHWKEWPTEGMHDKPVYRPKGKENKIAKKGGKRELDEDLAYVTHETMLALLDHTREVKKYVEMKGRTLEDSEVLRQTRDVLIDCCKLYCMTNSVGEKNMVKYISSLT